MSELHLQRRQLLLEPVSIQYLEKRTLLNIKEKEGIWVISPLWREFKRIPFIGASLDLNLGTGVPSSRML